MEKNLYGKVPKTSITCLDKEYLNLQEIVIQDSLYLIGENKLIRN